MKRVLLIIFSVVIISMSFSAYFYFTLKKVVPKDPNQLDRTMSFLSNDTTNYDIIFIGSSRVYAHIDPRIIDSACGVNSFCLSIDGGTITQDIVMLKKYFIHHKAPKLILVGLDYSSLQASLLPYNYPDYYPYLSDSIFATVNDKAIWRFRFSFLFEKYDAFIKYSTKTDYQKFATLSSCLGFRHKFEQLGGEPAWFDLMTYYKGFSGIDRKGMAESEAGLKEDWTIPREPQGISFLNDFITISKQHGSKPIILFSPMYHNSKKQFGETDNFFATINEISRQRSVPFLDYSDDPLCNDKNYFYDMFHMNITGAEKFSAKLASDINKLK